MRKLKAWGLSAALVAGLAAAAARAGDDGDGSEEAKPAPKPSSFHWSPGFAKVFGLNEKKPAPKKPAAKAKTTAKQAESPPKPATVVDEAAAERAREEATLLRRLQVSDKLMEIALKTNNNQLLHEAEALDERARTHYNQRTSYLRGSGGFVSDEKALDKYLGSGSAAVPRPPDAQAHTVAGNDRAAAKEVNP